MEVKAVSSTSRKLSTVYNMRISYKNCLPIRSMTFDLLDLLIFSDHTFAVCVDGDHSVNSSVATLSVFFIILFFLDINELFASKPNRADSYTYDNTL